MKSSVLIWSYKVPEFEEVQGKTIYSEYMGDQGVRSYAVKSLSMENYNHVFDGTFIRYAIIESLEMPLPLEGILPTGVTKDGRWMDYWVVEWRKERAMSIYVYGKTEDEAINNWNDLVRKMEPEP